MPKKTPKADVQKMQAKEQRQEKTIERYKKQTQWITWAAVVILLLILFFVLSMGYASNWWQNPTRTSQFAPYTTDTTSPSPGTSTETAGGTSTTTTRSGQTDTTSRTNTGTTTNNTTTETTTITNNNPASPAQPQPSDEFLTFSANTGTGDNIDQIINEANSRGIPVTCRTELLVRVCDFTDGEFTLTTKNLITGLSITGVSTNF